MPQKHIPPCWSALVAASSLFTSSAVTMRAETDASRPPDDYFAQRVDDAEGRKWIVAPQELPALSEITARQPDPFPVYGIYCWGTDFTQARGEIAKIGFRSIRLSGPWNEAEQPLLTAAREGVEVLYTVTNSQRHENIRGYRRPDFPSDDAFVSDFCDTMKEFLGRYGPGGSLYAGTGLKSPVRAVELLNEPNYHYMIPDRDPSGTVLAERMALYGQLVQAAVPMVRQASPDVKIVTFSTGGGGAIVADVPFIQGVTKTHPGINATYDILSTHPYMQGSPPDASKVKKWGPRALSQNLAALRKLLAKDGAAGKSIWYSEVGFPITQESGGSMKMPAYSKDFQVTPDIQAAYAVRQYLWSMRLGVDRVFLMSLFDADHFNSGVLERKTLVWRPVARAIRTLIDQLPNPHLTGAWSDDVNGLCAYRFVADHTLKDSPEVMVVWNVAGPTTVHIPWSEKRPATVLDMIGNRREVAPVDGAVTLEAGPYPLYLR